SLPSVDSFVQDVRYAFRLLRRSPGFTLGAVLTLAIGIGVNTTFTAVNAVMFRPLPVRDGDRLLRIERWFASGARGDGQYLFFEAEYRCLADHALARGSSGDGGPFADLVAESVPALVDAGGAQPLRLHVVSANYFDVLGSAMAAGRAFTPADPAADDTIVISYPFWQRQFGGDAGVAGRTIRLNRTTVTIAGVAPRTFIGTGNPPVVPDAWAPIAVASRVAPSVPTRRRFQVLGHPSP